MNVDIYGTTTYIHKEVLHREDGPAVIYSNGTKRWYIDGLLHRIDGPAVEWATGQKQWFIHGVEHTEKSYWQQLAKGNWITAFTHIFGNKEEK